MNVYAFIWIVCAMFTYGHMKPVDSRLEFVAQVAISTTVWPFYWGTVYRKNQ